MSTKKTTQKPKLIFTQPGKGGVGKTTCAATIVDFIKNKGSTMMLFDADEKARAGLAHFHPEAKKINLNRRDALDTLIHEIEGGPQIIFCDLPAAREEETAKWFEDVAEGVSEIAEIITVCVLTPDPGSIRPLLDWGQTIQDKTKYLVIKNEQEQSNHDWRFWTPYEAQFIEVAKAEVLLLRSINVDLNVAMRLHGETLSRVASGKVGKPELRNMRFQIRAQAVWRHFVDQLQQVEMLK